MAKQNNFIPPGSGSQKPSMLPALIIGGSIAIAFLLCVYFAVTGNYEATLAPVMAATITLTHPILLLSMMVFGVLSIPAALAAKKRREKFWQTVGESYGLVYAPKRILKGSKAVLLNQGHMRGATHVLTGTLHDLPFSMYEYVFLKQEGKTSRPYPFTVFEFTFKGAFPHLYLNYRNNYNPPERLIGGMPTVPLPIEFEKKFALHVPKQYEIEALAIFTPDTLAFLLDNGWHYDVEMIDQTMIVFGKPGLSAPRAVIEEIEKVTTLVEHLERKLHRAAYAPIGNKSPYL